MRFDRLCWDIGPRFSRSIKIQAPRECVASCLRFRFSRTGDPDHRALRSEIV